MSLSDLMEDRLWEHSCVEDSGDDEVSAHHMSSREQEKEPITGIKVSSAAFSAEFRCISKALAGCRSADY